MSGSPIVLDDGSAIGLVSQPSQLGTSCQSTEGGPQPVLTLNLPVWFFRRGWGR
jgi:hypothetical protein